MYNLFVVNNEDGFTGRYFTLPRIRCVNSKEYTHKDIYETYGDFLDKNILEKIKSFPCIFTHENDYIANSINPKYGYIENIDIRRSDDIRIFYRIEKSDGFITYDQFIKKQLDLDIFGYELNRTHWAIKNVDLLQELQNSNTIISRNKKFVDITKHYFDVALSFPGEAREIVRSIANELNVIAGNNTYFYDQHYQAQLARPNLDSLLQDIYRNRSKLVVIFFGEDYQKKEWCGIEFRAIREIIMEKEIEKIMFFKLDDGRVDGIFKMDGYIDVNKFSPFENAEFILERLQLLNHESEGDA